MRLRHSFFTAAALASFGMPASAADKKPADDYSVHSAVLQKIDTPTKGMSIINECGFIFDRNHPAPYQPLNRHKAVSKGGQFVNFRMVQGVALVSSRDTEEPDRVIYKIVHDVTSNSPDVKEDWSTAGHAYSCKIQYGLPIECKAIPLPAREAEAINEQADAMNTACVEIVGHYRDKILESVLVGENDKLIGRTQRLQYRLMGILDNLQN